MRSLSARDAVCSVLVLAGVCAVLAPAVARMQRSPADAKCQSNLRQWARAMELYLVDFDGCYPTNQVIGINIASSVNLSDPGTGADGNPRRFQYGINWVEALYPYLWSAAKRTDQDWESFMRCPNASTATYPSGSLTARMTYTFNRSLVRNSAWVIKDPSNLMMFREVDRLVNAVLRPINDATRNTASIPRDPFLNHHDWTIKITNPSLHANGSYIVFADGHVRFFPVEYYPEAAIMTMANCWDEETLQWYNYGPGSAATKPAYLIKSIAITP